MAQHETETFGQITLTGIKTYTGPTTAATDTVYVLIKDGAGDILLCTGTVLPTDDHVGYAKGCLFIDTDVADNTSGLYVNIGTTLLCSFKLVSNA